MKNVSFTTITTITSILIFGTGAWLLSAGDSVPTDGISPAPLLAAPHAPHRSDPPPVMPPPPTLASRTDAMPDAPAAVDPCSTLRSENDRHLEEIGRLHARIELIESYGGRTPYDHFLQTPGVHDSYTNEQRLWLRNLMESECPFYLLPDEATYLVAMRDETGGYDSFEEMMIRLLGSDRVLREAPPSWTSDMADLFLPDEWLSIFGTPHPG